MYGSIKVQLNRMVFSPLSNVGYMTCMLSSGVADEMIPQGPFLPRNYTNRIL